MKYLNHFLWDFHHQGDEMEDKNTTTDANFEISKGHEKIHSNSETDVRSSLPLVPTENDTDDGSDSEDENFREGVVNMLDFVSELQ